MFKNSLYFRILVQIKVKEIAFNFWVQWSRVNDQNIDSSLSAMACTI